jgi:hypothetical protein
MLQYGMVGDIDDFARVVVWDFDQGEVGTRVLEKEIQLFVPEFKLAEYGFSEDISEIRFLFSGAEAKGFHVLEPKKDCLVYFFVGGKLKKYPVKDVYLLFKKAF